MRLASIPAAVVTTRLTALSCKSYLHLLQVLMLNTCKFPHVASYYQMQVPAESELEPESEAEEKHAKSEAANPNSDAITLDDYEKQGHTV